MGCPGQGQCGAVFKLDTNGVETVLYNFTGPDGANPTSSLIMDANGDFYGTTEYGGKTSICVDTEYAGCGVVFKLSAAYRNRPVPLQRERGWRISLAWGDHGCPRRSLRHDQ